MKKTFENFKDVKFTSLESAKLNSIKGGRNKGGMTLNCVTVTPTGTKDDGHDPDDDLSHTAADVPKV